MSTNKLSRENVTKDYPSLLGTSGKKEREKEREGRPDGQAALTNTTTVSLPTDATRCPELLISRCLYVGAIPDICRVGR